MKPELFSFPHIDSYPVLLLFGFFFGYGLARLRAPACSIARAHIDNLTLILLVAGPLGARLFARLFYDPSLNFWQALKVWEGGGLVFYGGFLFGIGSVALYSFIRKVPIVPLMDTFSPSVALGLAFGRIGCFLAGCCWGDVCLTPAQEGALQASPQYYQVHSLPAISRSGLPWAVRFPQGSTPFKQHQKLGLIPPSAEKSLPVHPVQIYEAVLATLLCFGLHQWSKTKPRPGNMAIGLVIGYALIRFSTEFLRADNNPAYWGMTFSQAVSVLMAGAGVVSLWLRSRAASRWAAPALAKTAGEPG